MDVRTHWEKIYTEKAPDAVSWYRRHLEKSLALIEQLNSNRSASIIDIGGGESTLVDDLVASGYGNITVLDISQAAIDATRKRLGMASGRVHLLSRTSRRSIWKMPLMMCGTTAQSFIFLPRQRIVSPISAKSPAR